MSESYRQITKKQVFFVPDSSGKQRLSAARKGVNHHDHPSMGRCEHPRKTSVDSVDEQNVRSTTKLCLGPILDL